MFPPGLRFVSTRILAGAAAPAAKSAAPREYDLRQLESPVRADAPAPRSGLPAALLLVLLRLKYLLLTLPIVGLGLAVYAGVHAAFGETNAVPLDSTLLPPCITCVFFVLSIVFSNVIADYKESEKIPAEFVAYFSSLASFAVSEAREHGFSARPLLLDVQAMLLCVLSTLDKKRGFVADMHAFHSAAVAFKTYARARGVHEIEGPEHAQDEIVKKLTRIHDIGRLSIILPACACAAIRC